MKNTRLSAYIFIFFGFLITSANAQDVNLCKNFYNKTLMANNLIIFTNEYIDSKAKAKPNVPDYVWNSIKQDINYNSFEEEAVKIFCEKYNRWEMQKAISSTPADSFIELPSPAIQKELFKKLTDFQNSVVDKRIALVLRAAGYN